MNIPHILSRRQEFIDPQRLMETSWYRTLSDLFNWVGFAGTESSITVTASPFSYTAPKNGWVVVNPGTVSAIAISRNGTTFYTTGVTSGVFPLAASDQIKVTYTGAPTMTFFPR